MKKLFLVMVMVFAVSGVFAGDVLSIYNGKIIEKPGYLTYKDNALNTGDIIVIKFKEQYRQDWSWIAHDWQHSLIFNTNNVLLHAPGPGKKSEKIDWNTFKSKFPYYKVKQAILIKFNFMDYQMNDMKNFQDKYLLGKYYPRIRNILTTKYSWDTFYCSSLIWRAHYSTINSYINLDSNSDNMVWPYELFLSNYGKQYVITWGKIKYPLLRGYLYFNINKDA